MLFHLTLHLNARRIRRCTCVVHKRACFLDKKIHLFSFGSFTEHPTTKVKRGKERELTVMKCPPGTSHTLMHLIFPVRYQGELLLALLYRRGNWNWESFDNLLKFTPQVSEVLFFPLPQITSQSAGTWADGNTSVWVVLWFFPGHSARATQLFHWVFVSG